VTNKKLHSPVPYFILTALWGAVPVLNNMYPRSFFPSVSSFGVELLSVFAGVAAVTLGLFRGWAILLQREKARDLVRGIVRNPAADAQQDPNDRTQAGRTISRLVRNADQDLREIGPDFTPGSLERLARFFPVIMKEIESEEDARIRMGVVGVYLGETACRTGQWQWFFKVDPALQRFGYLASTLKKGERELDPFAWAVRTMTGQAPMDGFMDEMKK